MRTVHQYIRPLLPYPKIRPVNMLWFFHCTLHCQNPSVSTPRRKQNFITIRCTRWSRRLCTIYLRSWTKNAKSLFRKLLWRVPMMRPAAYIYSSAVSLPQFYSDFSFVTRYEIIERKYGDILRLFLQTSVRCEFFDRERGREHQNQAGALWLERIVIMSAREKRNGNKGLTSKNEQTKKIAKYFHIRARTQSRAALSQGINFDSSKGHWLVIGLKESGMQQVPDRYGVTSLDQEYPAVVPQQSNCK